MKRSILDLSGLGKVSGECGAVKVVAMVNERVSADELGSSWPELVRQVGKIGKVRIVRVTPGSCCNRVCSCGP